MAFCSNCGAKLSDDMKFCVNCGTPAIHPNGNSGTTQQQAYTQNPGGNQQQSSAQDPKNDFSEKFAEFTNTTDTTASMNPEDIRQNKVYGILAYISWLVLIPWLAAPNSKFARFHANQGLTLAIIETAWWLVEIILSVVLTAISWRLSVIVSILGLVNLIFVAFIVLGIVNVAEGKAKELPIIGSIQILK